MDNSRANPRRAEALKLHPKTNDVQPDSAEGVSFEAVAQEVFRRYGRSWKPRTLTVNRSYLRKQIVPWFHGHRIADITHEQVQHWFSSLRSQPSVANRALPILSVIMRQAEIYGYRSEDTNPCSGIRRYRLGGRERFLSLREIGRLGAALTAREAAFPLSTAVVRLLLLTGCRQGEMRTLKWREYREGHLFLGDGKTGPRTVWLSSPARQVLDGLPRTGRWTFPASKGRGPLTADALYRCWGALREAAHLPDVRLHDLRHSYASFALTQGESVPMIGRLLGHRDPATTLKYTHFADSTAREAVEVVGTTLEC